MKNIKFLILIFLVAAFSCTEKDLETTATTDNALTFYQQDENVETAIWTAYYALQVRTGPWGNSHISWGNFASDDAYSGGADGLDQESYQLSDTYKSTPQDPANNLATMWKANFQGIYACNLIIDNVKPTSDIKAKAIAEAKFVKGLSYFYLARMFGGLPLHKKAADPSDKVARATQQETYEYIASVLEEAVNQKNTDGVTPALPIKKSLTEVPNDGRATLASAQALLGKVYLYLGKYNEAIDVLTKVTANANYQLEPVYANIFNPNLGHSKEGIFTVNYTMLSGPNQEALGLGEMQLYGPRSVSASKINDTIATGWGFNQPTADLVNAYKNAGDIVRLNAAVISSDSLEKLNEVYYKPIIKADSAKNFTAFQKKYKDLTDFSVNNVYDNKFKRIWTNNKDGYWDKKHMPNPKNQGTAWGNIKYNLVVLRLADVHLMLAEAYNKTGNDSKAQEHLNIVRNRAKLGNITSTGAELLAAIKNERRLELSLEGERYFDLVRWGDADQVLGPLGYSTGTPGTKTKGLFPIPQNEINATGYAQNEGY